MTVLDTVDGSPVIMTKVIYAICMAETYIYIIHVHEHTINSYLRKEVIELVRKNSEYSCARLVGILCISEDWVRW